MNSAERNGVNGRSVELCVLGCIQPGVCVMEPRCRRVLDHDGEWVTTEVPGIEVERPPIVSGPPPCRLDCAPNEHVSVKVSFSHLVEISDEVCRSSNAPLGDPHGAITVLHVLGIADQVA